MRTFIKKNIEKLIGPIERLLIKNLRHNQSLNEFNTQKKNVLIIGIYLSKSKNYSRELKLNFATSKFHAVDQFWVKLQNGKSTGVENFIVDKMPKFEIIEYVLKNGFIDDGYDYYIISDDDIRVNKEFIDGIIGAMVEHDLAMGQPARSCFSEISHEITRKKYNSNYRMTNFVEIGPIIILRKDAISSIQIKFEESRMGYGYDYIWPMQLKKINLKMGIIDTVVIQHGMRLTGKSYDHFAVKKQMINLLNSYEHIEKIEEYTKSMSIKRSWKIEK